MANSKQQIAGDVGEGIVELKFKTWGWVCSRDHVDVGYDLGVMPEHNLFDGGRFFVQVKSSMAKREGEFEFCRVLRRRLIQYCENPSPVFLMKVSSEGCIYWLHIQDWIGQDNNKRFLSGGEGLDVKIKMNLTQLVSNKDEFVQYLSKHMVSRKVHGSAGKLLKQRADYLSSIDERISVSLSASENGEAYSISGSKVSDHKVFNLPPIRAKIVPKKTLDDITALTEAIHFGLPRNVNLDLFELSGSELFNGHIPNAFSGRFLISSELIYPSRVKMSYKQGKSSGALCSLSANLYKGRTASSVETGPNDLIGFTMKMSMFTANVSLYFNDTLLCSKPLAEFIEISDWTDKIFNFSKVTTFKVEVISAIGKLTSEPSKTNFDEDQFNEWLLFFTVIKRAYDMCLEYKSGFVFTPNEMVSDNQLLHLFVAHYIQSGNTFKINVNRSSGDFTKEINDDGRAFCLLPVSLGSTNLCMVPMVATKVQGGKMFEGGDGLECELSLAKDFEQGRGFVKLSLNR